MKTPREKYEGDSSYRVLVDHLVSMIHQCQFTPSELREAVMLACIIYEEHNIRQLCLRSSDPETESATAIIKRLDEKINKGRLYNLNTKEE